MMSDKRFGENATRKAVGITETSLRDGHQSLMATRMRTDDMLPVVDMMEEIWVSLFGSVGRGDV